MEVMMLIILIAIVYWISLGFFCAWLAEEKGRNFYAWCGLGLVFGFIALLFLAGAPALEYEEDDEDEEEELPRRSSRRPRSR